MYPKGNCLRRAIETVLLDTLLRPFLFGAAVPRLANRSMLLDSSSASSIGTALPDVEEDWINQHIPTRMEQLELHTLGVLL